MSDNSNRPVAVCVTARPLLADLWARTCARSGITAIAEADGANAKVDVALVDAASAPRPLTTESVILLIDAAAGPAVFGPNWPSPAAVVTWDDDQDELAKALSAALGNRSYVSPTAGPAVLRALSSYVRHRSPAVERLTPREVDVLEAMVDGATIRSTARALGVAVKTVEAQRSSAYTKLGVRTRSEAIAKLLDDPSLLRAAGE